MLDFGCGEGYLGRKLQQQGCTVTGLDISNDLLSSCPFPTRKADLNAVTDFPDDSFDTVVCSDVLEHLNDPEASLAEMKRLARKHVVISVPNSTGFLLFKLFPTIENPHEKYSPHLHHWGRRSFPWPDMPLTDFVYCTDIFELRFTNLLRISPLAQTMVMRFDAAAGKV